MTTAEDVLVPDTQERGGTSEPTPESESTQEQEASDNTASSALAKKKKGKQPDPKERASRLLEVNRKLKESWLVKLRASYIEVPTGVHNEALHRIFEQTFLVTARNLFFISKYGRALMGESDIASAEEAIVKSITDIHQDFDGRHIKTKELIEELERISASSSSPDRKLYRAQYPQPEGEDGQPTKDVVRVTSPISFNHLKLFWALDQYLLDLDTLMLNGVRTMRQYNTEVFQAKSRMRTLAYNIRTHAKTISNRYSHAQVQKAAQEKDTTDYRVREGVEDEAAVAA